MGTPYFILASGQSNIQGQSLLNWSPNPRAKIWNNDQENDASVGTGYGALQSNICGIAPRYAHKIAEGDPNKDVYLARCAKQGRDILTWVGGGIFAFTGGYGDGTIVFNTAPNAATIIALSPKDVYGVRRPYFPINALSGETLWLKQGSAVYQYVLTSNPDVGATLTTLYVTLVSAVGTITTGNIQVEFQPRLLTGMDNVVPAALAAAGKSTIDIFLWWQGESDAEYNTRYENEFGFLLSTLSTRPWWSPNTKVIICSPNWAANNNLPWVDAFNTRLANIAAGGSNRYFANIPANVAPSDWQDVYHMTGQGYSNAGDYLFNSVYTPPQVGGGGGGGSGTITGISVGALSTLMDVSSNPAHQMLSGSTSYGLWIDGCPHPYRDGSGNMYLLLPHSENYRLQVPNLANPAGWILQGRTLEGARLTQESAYNNRNWLYCGWASGNTVYGLMHHEWYTATKVVDGIDGFPSYAFGFNKRWVNAISWAQSANGGLTWSSSSATNSARLPVIPEPWGIQSGNHMYGFFHPSNIVQEGSYYYAAIEQRTLEPGGETCVCGVSLIRTTNLSSPTGWQFWNGSAWEGVNHATYQGNLGQQVHRFFQISNISIYTSGAYNSHMGQSIRWHAPTSQWIMFGYFGTGGTGFGFSTSSTLASPQFTSIQTVSVVDQGSYGSGNYRTVFDESATDQNFQSISGPTATVLLIKDFTLIRKATMTISYSSTAPTYSVTPSTSSVNEGGTVTFTVTTTGVGSGTLYWTNAGTTVGTDFNDGVNSGTISITNDSGSFSRTLTNDATLEGSETIIIQLRSGSTGGTIVATATTVTVNDTSVPSQITYAVSPSVSSVNEGGSVTYTVTTTNFGNGTLYWTNSGSTTSSDFNDGVNSGAISIVNNSGSVTRTVNSDLSTEGNETIVFQLRTSSTAGTIVAIASTVTVNDTSVTPSGNKFRIYMGNGSWLDASLASNFRFRSPDNQSWINRTGNMSNLFVRNASNNGWIPFTTTVIPPTYSIAPSATNVNEGQTVTFTVTTTNFGSGTLYWSNSGTSVAADFNDGLNAGSVTITNNSGLITRVVSNDAVLEGAETLITQLRTGSTSGTVVATASTVTINDTSVPAAPTYAITVSNATVSEGQTVTYTLTTTNVPNNTFLPWTNAGTTTNADFAQAPTSFNVQNNSATLAIVLANDLTGEGSETLILQVRTGSLSGPIVATAPTVTVNDTSVPAAPTYAISASTNSVNEGSSISFPITTTNFGNGTLYWTNSGTALGADFTDGLNAGSIAISNNSGTLVRTLNNDLTAEGTESIQIQLRTGSTAGTIVATSPAALINDTSIPAAPTSLTMNRNNLDFVYLPDQVTSNSSAALDYRVTLTTTNFFNYALNADDHIAIVLDCGGEGGNNDPHCGPIYRNGRNIWVTARGFFITRSLGVYSEIWNGTFSPVVNPVTNTSGQTLNFTSGTFTIRVRAGYRAGFFANLMTITITAGSSIYDPVVFQGSVGIGTDWVGFHRVALAAISGGFIAPSPASGCVETSAPGPAFGGVIPFSNFSLSVY